MTEPGQPQQAKTVELCVYCRRQAVDAEWRPFCSERCKLQDLARWAGESYRVPADPVVTDHDADPDENDG